MSWRSGTATIAVLSLAMLPLSIGSASADATAQPSPSASPTQDISTPPASAPQDSPSAHTPSAPAPSEAAPTTDAGSSAPVETKTIIVTFDKAQSDPAQAAESAVAKAADQVAEAKVTKVAPITNSMVAVTLDSPLTATETDKIETQVSDAKGVKAAQGSGWFRPATNDEFYDRLWNLNSAGTYGTHAEAAWASSTGDSAVVGVIDTGITAHPDLTGSSSRIVGGNVVDGYDFITDAAVAGDGNGRDSNPSDTGDFFSDREGFHSSSWHGTHVAGIIAALANNSIGIAGVAPHAKLEPLRALGRGGGEEQDVIAAIYWGAGLPVNGLPANSQPADVLNLSLGMAGDCSTAMQTAINAATAKGVVVVAAAGNGDASGNGLPVYQSSPANCANVVSVGATTKLGTLASYSNYGDASELTISAPGGSGSYTSDIFSTLNSGITTTSAAVYDYMAGTSMAAPHVAGTVALLKSLDPGMTLAEAKALLTNTADTVPSCGQCGAGRLNTSAAVAALVTSLGVTPASLPLQTAAPQITGTAQVGHSLSVATTANTTAALGYQWYRNGAKVSGATGQSYPVTSSDKGKSLLVKVTASLAGQTTIQFSEETSRVAAGVLLREKYPKASGTFKKGRTVTASKGTWSPSPSGYSYRWLRNGKSISGATKSRYKLTYRDRGKRISVRVTVTKAGYTTVSATSSTHKVKR